MAADDASHPGAMKLALVRTGRELRPANAASEREIERLPAGKLVLADVKRPRNPRRHALWWALCSALAEALNSVPGSDHDWTAEMVSNRLKMATGRAQIVELPADLAKHYGTRIGVIPTSISFAAMDETEFARLMDAAMAYVSQSLGAALEHPAMREVREMIYGPDGTRVPDADAAMGEANRGARPAEGQGDLP